MPRLLIHLSVFIVLAIANLAFFERSANAAGPVCSSFTNTIVIESGDTQEPLLKTLGQELRNSATPMTVLYKLTGTCTVASDLMLGHSIAQNATLSYTPSTTEDPTWNPSKPSATCTVDAAGGLPIQLGIGATFLTSCTLPTPTATVGQFFGPIGGYGFAIPKASSQVAMTAEEGFFVFGYGTAGKITPWNDENYMFARTSTKSTALTLGSVIHVPAGKLKGLLYDQSSQVLDSVATSTDPEKTIGLLGTEIYDANRDKVNLLAFRAFEQKYAYFPDSTATSFDKKNLRDGHYIPWAPTVYIAPTDGSGDATGNAKTFIDLVLGNTKYTDVDGLAASIKVGLIPSCAMQVNRPADGADLALYSPAQPCGCYFESAVPNGSTKCTACSDDGPCGGGKCRDGYCEAR
jgi:hypothetical protein